jgi:hypothetical protein
MLEENVHYKSIVHKTYKYLCVQSFKSYTKVVGYDIDHKYFRLFSDGVLIIKKGYACDGASGPTLDDKTNIHAGFVHDALYQMLRLRLIGTHTKMFKKDRKLADQTFLNQLKRDGMPPWRRWYYYLAVRWFGKVHATPETL